MCKVTDVEPLIYNSKVFGVTLWKGDRRCRYTNFNIALSAVLTKSQRRYIERIKLQCVEQTQEK